MRKVCSLRVFGRCVTAVLLVATIMTLVQMATDAVPMAINQWRIQWIWGFNLFVGVDVAWLALWRRLATHGDQEGGDDQDKSRKQENRRLHDRVFKTIVTLLCIAITVNLGRLMPVDVTNVHPADVGVGFFFYLFVLLNGGWFFYLLAPLVRRRILNAILFMVLFVCGCSLYYFLPVDDSISKNADKAVQYKVERQIEAPNRTVAAFFPSRGGFETVAKGNGKATSKEERDSATPHGSRMLYFVFHTFVLFYVALITFAIFGRGIVNRVRKWIIRWKHLNVFWGRSDVGLLLARSLLQSTERDQVFFMFQQKSGDGDEWRTLTRDIDDMDGMWSFTYDSNAVETDVSKDKLSQAKGRRHFFMDESGHVNVSMADRIVSLLRENRPTPGIGGLWKAFRAGMIVRWWKDCYVHIWNESRKWWKENTSKNLMKDFMAWWNFCKDMWKQCKWDKPFLYVRIEAPSDELTYQTWAANVCDVVTPVLIRESQLIAKSFIKKYPLLKMRGVVENIDKKTAQVKVDDIKILIIGFGAAGQDVLNEIVCNGQFVKEYDKDGTAVPVHLHVDIVERDEKVIEEYCIRHPLATRHPKFSDKSYGDKRYDVNFIQGSFKEGDRLSAVEVGGKRYEVNLEKSVRVEDKTFDDWFRGRLDDEGKKCPYDRIIVCLKGDEKTLGIAHKIVEFTRRYCSTIDPDVVFARVKDPSRNRYLQQEKGWTIFSKNKETSTDEDKEHLCITLFGNMNDIYSFERINVEDVDTMAKILNNRHGNCGQDVEDDKDHIKEEAWGKASFFDQLSSRAAAEGQRNILLLLGMDYRENLKEDKATEDKATEGKEAERKEEVECVPWDKVDDLVNGDSVEKKLLLRTLAINEHLRWNAFHLMLGYRPWDILDRSDDPLHDLPEEIRKKQIEQKKVKANQLGTIGRHADIIEFERLPDVDMKIAAMKAQKSREELHLKREKFVWLAPYCAQGYDVAFCKIVGTVAEKAKKEIVRPIPQDGA